LVVGRDFDFDCLNVPLLVFICNWGTGTAAVGEEAGEAERLWPVREDERGAWEAGLEGTEKVVR
jgi:hypothetical protein